MADANNQANEENLQPTLIAHGVLGEEFVPTDQGTGQGPRNAFLHDDELITPPDSNAGKKVELVNNFSNFFFSATGNREIPVHEQILQEQDVLLALYPQQHQLLLNPAAGPSHRPDDA